MYALYLERLLSFSQNREIQCLTSNTDRALIVAEVNYLKQGQVHEPSRPFSGTISEGEWISVVEYQKQWCSCVDWLFAKFNSDWQLLIEIPYIFFWESEQNGEFHLSKSFNKKLTVKAIGNEDQKAEKKIFPEGSQALFHALSHFRKSRIVRCDQCRKIFFNPSNRNMKYCSVSCRSLAGVHRFREKTDTSIEE